MLSLDSIITFYSSFGYLSVFGMLLLCGFGVPIPEDVSIIAGGIIAGLGYGNIHLMCVISFLGVMIGDIIVYNMGRIFGNRIFDRKFGKKILEHGWYDKIIKSFNQNGKMVLFAARFMPGLRTPIFLTAGITKFVGFPSFIIIDGFSLIKKSVETISSIVYGVNEYIPGKSTNLIDGCFLIVPDFCSTVTPGKLPTC